MEIAQNPVLSIPNVVSNFSESRPLLTPDRHKRSLSLTRRPDSPSTSRLVGSSIKFRHGLLVRSAIEGIAVRVIRISYQRCSSCSPPDDLLREVLVNELQVVGLVNYISERVR